MKNYYKITESERLRYRLLTMSDLPIWERFILNPSSTSYFPDLMKGDASKAKIWVEKQLERYEENRFGLFAIEIKETQTFIGQCGLLSQLINDKNYLEVGYHLLEEYTGKGYAIEAAKHFKNIAKDNAYAQNLISIIHVANAPSIKVAHKNGMKPIERVDYFGMDAQIYGCSLVK